MEPRDLAGWSLMVSLGAVALGLGAWMLGFGLGGEGLAASPVSLLVLLAGLAVLAAGAFLVGGAGLDALWLRLQGLRARGRPPAG